MYDFRVSNGTTELNFYGSEQGLFKPYGPSYFGFDGRPMPSGWGSFSIKVNGMRTKGPAETGSGVSEYDQSNSYLELISLWAGVFNTTNKGYLTVTTFDPRSNNWINVKARLKFPQLAPYHRGVALEGITLEFFGAFFSGSVPDGYYGGDPYPNTTPPDYIPSDPLPPADPTLEYGWGVGGWNNGGLWGRGEGVPI